MIALNSFFLISCKKNKKKCTKETIVRHAILRSHQGLSISFNALCVLLMENEDSFHLSQEEKGSGSGLG